MNKILTAVSAACMAFAATASHAAVYHYDLSDNGTAGLTTNGSGYSYGLRLDGQMGVATGDVDNRFILSFDQGDATLRYDDDLGIAIIHGQMRRSLAGGGFGDMWSVHYVMTGVTDLGGGLFIDNAGFGSGTVSDGTSTFDLGAKDRSGDFFLLTHGTSTRTDSTGLPVGEGWVNTQDTWGTTNDFLFNASLDFIDDDGNLSAVPLPAAGWMLIAAVGGLGAMRRRKQAS